MYTWYNGFKNTKHEHNQHIPPKCRQPFEGRCLIVLFYPVFVYMTMTARSWTNVWHTTFTKYTQMSVLQCGGCLNICICQLYWSIIRLYFNCDYTQSVWEQISNTNQFIKNAQPTGGSTVPKYPLRVYSEILMTFITRGQWNSDRSHSLVVMHHDNPQESESALYQHACKCV